MKSDRIIDLYKSQSKVITYYLIKNGCSLEDAQDIMHDSFIKAIKYIDGVDNNKISSWLFKVAINTYRDYIRKNKKATYISIDNDEFYIQLLDERDMFDELLIKENNNKINLILNEMKEEYKSILIFKYDMELSYKEIALFLGKTEDVVKTYIYRARNKFKDEWRKLSE